MIQAPLPKPVEAPKKQLPTKAERSEANSNIKSQKLAGKEVKKTEKEQKEFSSELESQLKGAESETKQEAKQGEVQPVKVSAEQILELPSTMVQPGAVETAAPKVFDQELTKDVEKLIQPKTTEAAPVLTDAEVIQLANAEGVDGVQFPEMPLKEVKGEFPQPMLKAAPSRQPAIEFAKSEVDPQLLNNEDFVTQKNLATKKAVSNPYGMKAAPVQQQKIALEAGLKESQIVKEATLPAAENSSVNSQQFILGLQTEKPSQVAETQGSAKVFDMNSIKNSNPTEIMNQITDYVVQAKAAKEPTVNMRVNHEELGMIDITVSKSGLNQEAIAVQIGTHTVDGKNFFQQNSKDLFSHLTTAGLNVSDLKVETPTQTAKNDFDFGSQSGRNNQQGSEKQFGSEQNQRRHESERRQDLWKLLNKEAA